MKTKDEILDQISIKIKEIEHYDGVLLRSQGSRWYDQGTRRYAVLNAELAELKSELITCESIV